MKKCTKCNVNLPLSNFSKDSRNKLGLRPRCKSCTNTVNKDWRDSNPESFKIYRKKNYQLNKDKNLKLSKLYAESHKAEKALYDIQYRKDNKDSIANYKKKWEQTQRLTNPIFKIKITLEEELHTP